MNKIQRPNFRKANMNLPYLHKGFKRERESQKDELMGEGSQWWIMITEAPTHERGSLRKRGREVEIERESWDKYSEIIEEIEEWFFSLFEHFWVLKTTCRPSQELLKHQLLEIEHILVTEWWMIERFEGLVLL